MCIQHAKTKSTESLIPLLSKPLNAEALIVLYQALANIFRSAADYHNSKKHFQEVIWLAKSLDCTWRGMECMCKRLYSVILQL